MCLIKKNSFIDRNLYFGSNGANNVYSFLPSSGARITNFSADLNDFFKVHAYFVLPY